MDEVKKVFDGSHNKGTLTFAAAGSSTKHQRVTLFLEIENQSLEGTPEMKVECQLTVEQARHLILMLSESVSDLGTIH